MTFDVQIEERINNIAAAYICAIKQHMVNFLYCVDSSNKVYSLIVDKKFAFWHNLTSIFHNNLYCIKILDKIVTQLLKDGFVVAVEANLGKKRWFRRKTTYNMTLVVSWRIA